MTILLTLMGLSFMNTSLYDPEGEVAVGVCIWSVRDDDVAFPLLRRYSCPYLGIRLFSPPYFSVNSFIVLDLILIMSKEEGSAIAPQNKSTWASFLKVKPLQASAISPN